MASIEESIQRVKAEIIAPDWRLSAKRIESLAAAFACLKDRYKSRRSLHAILTMADNVLAYVKVRGDSSPPDSIDFLKEAMAHVVNFHEDGDFDPEMEERTLKKVYARFQELRKKISTLRGAPARRPAGSGSQSESQAEPSSSPAISVPEDAAKPVHAEFLPPGSVQEVERLLAELRNSIRKAEEAGANLRQLLSSTMALKGGAAGIGPTAGEEHGLPSHRPSEVSQTKNCPPTAVREVTLGNQVIAIPEDGIALIRPVATAARTAYLRNAQVPLRDFARFFQGLAGQFNGMLATMKDRKLKKLVLPIITPQSMDLPETPDDQASTLLVLTYGHWHGVLLCAAVAEARVMVKFRKAPNGDIAGIGFFEEGGELPVINLMEFLRREGFLAVV